MAPLKKILIYTPNSIGLGHLFRTSAVATGMRRWRPEIDFLIITGSSLSQVLSGQGLEVVKLPGVKQEVSGPNPCYRPRYLNGLHIDDLMLFRRKIITESFEFFKPDVVILEHEISGLMGEARVLLQKKRQAIGRPGEFALIHLSRGIMGRKKLQRRMDPGRDHNDILALYDYLYILEDEALAPDWRDFRDTDPVLASKIRFPGKTVSKNKDELPARREVLGRLRLPDWPIVLASLGRHGDIPGLFARILEAKKDIEQLNRHQVILVEDPYLDVLTGRKLKTAALREKAVILPFFPDLVDLIGISDLVICRAGYNTINEVLMTGVKALVVPEHHPSGEQEIRAAGLEGPIRIIREEEALEQGLERILLEILACPAAGHGNELDKYDIGRRIMEDLETWAAGRRPV